MFKEREREKKKEFQRYIELFFVSMRDASLLAITVNRAISALNWRVLLLR